MDATARVVAVPSEGVPNGLTKVEFEEDQQHRLTHSVVVS